MNNYKRLTEKDEEYGNFVPNRGSELNNPKIAVSYNGKIHGTIIDRLADLEDKIENGTLVELPCKVGDTIYVPYQYNGVEGISFHKIYQIVIMENDIYVDFEVDTDIDYVFAYIYNFGKFNIAWLNKRFFLTKAEAENKLKELQ